MDQQTDRLLLAYGHALTVDSAQRITSGEHINAMPCGTAGATSFKSYVTLLHGSLGPAGLGRMKQLTSHRCLRKLSCRSRPTPTVATTFQNNGIG